MLDVLHCFSVFTVFWSLQWIYYSVLHCVALLWCHMAYAAGAVAAVRYVSHPPGYGSKKKTHTTVMTLPFWRVKWIIAPYSEVCVLNAPLSIKCHRQCIVSVSTTKNHNHHDSLFLGMYSRLPSYIQVKKLIWTWIQMGIMTGSYTNHETHCIQIPWTTLYW